MTRLNPRGRSPRRAAKGGSTGADISVKFLSQATCCLPLTKSIFVVTMSFLQGKRRTTFVQNLQNLCQTGARKLLRVFHEKCCFLGYPNFNNTTTTRSSTCQTLKTRVSRLGGTGHRNTFTLPMISQKIALDRHLRN